MVILPRRRASLWNGAHLNWHALSGVEPLMRCRLCHVLTSDWSSDRSRT